MEKLLLKPEEAAELIGVSRAKLYVLMNVGDVPSVRVGSRLRVPVEALREWIAARVVSGQV